MQKKKIFKIEDSNIEGIGTDADKECRASAAETEKAWKKVKAKESFHCWRIENFKVKKNEDAKNGVFYNDDSYIVLKIYKKEDKLCSDIHFWLGETTSQDEYGTAAYKTVELDDFINAKHGFDPIQHREVSKHESGLFLSYYPHGIRLLDGGVASGFNHVEPESYKSRLLWMKGKKKIRVTEVPISVKSLNSGDVFILDCGLNLYQYQGKAAGKNEKLQAGKLQRMIDDERRGKPDVFVFSQTDKPDDTMGIFFSYFEESSKEPGQECDAEECAKLLATISEDAGGDDAAWEKDSEKSLWQLSDASGKLTFTEVAKGKVKKDKLVSDDVFIFDVGSEIFVWVGSKASKSEKKQGMIFASKYLKEHDRPAYLPVSQIFEGGENEVFEGSFD